MKVLVSGASGAIGRFLIPQLVEAGHEVAGLTRRQDKADALAGLGARGVVVDALDREAVRRAVLAEAPDAVIDELTSLPKDFNLRNPHLYDANDEIRSKGTPALHDAAREAGVRRFVMQSVAFLYAPEGDWVKPEDAPMWLDAPGRSLAACASCATTSSGSPVTPTSRASPCATGSSTAPAPTTPPTARSPRRFASASCRSSAGAPG